MANNVLMDRVLVVQVTFHRPAKTRSFRRGEAIVQKQNGTESTRADQSQVKANRLILPRGFFNAVEKIDRDFGDWLESISLDRQGVTKDLPPLVHGARVIPASLREEVESRIDKAEEAYAEAADELASTYEQAKTEQAGRLRELYDPSRYDSLRAFRAKFYVSRRLLSWSPESREKDVKRVVDEIRDALLTGFAEYMEKIFDSLSDGKVYTEKAHAKTLEFLKRINDLNVFDDAKLVELRNQAEELLAGRSAEDVRANKFVGRIVQSGARRLGYEAVALLSDKPKRKFSFGLNPDSGNQEGC